MNKTVKSKSKSFAIILSEQRKVDKVFIAKQKNYLVKTWQGGGKWGKALRGVFLLTS